MALIHAPYDPVAGINSPIERFEFNLDTNKVWHLPLAMKENVLLKDILNYKKTAKQYFIDKKDISLYPEFIHALGLERFKYDFEYWAITTIKITDKETGVEIPYRLNRAQRRLLSVLESQRLNDRPIRIIINKARQMGSSTLIQTYMNWLQIVLYVGWNSAIVADVEEQARTVRRFQTDNVNKYPIENLTLRNFEGSSKNKEIIERECVISIASMQKPHSLRSKDLKMCHLSEVGFWITTEGKKPQDVIRSIKGTIKSYSGTMIAMESTANGAGTFFHTEYLMAKNNNTAYIAFFAAWYEDERNLMSVPDYEEFIKTWNDYEKWLWSLGVTIEGIYWYRYVFEQEYNSDKWTMFTENPSDAEESFQSTGVRYIPPQYIENIDNPAYITEPMFKGDLFPHVDLLENCLKDIDFQEYVGGNCWIWAKPDSAKISNRYLVIVDIGGKSPDADWSVIRVLDRYWLIDGGIPEYIFTCKIHLDPDLVAWKAMQIAAWYNNALLAVESNYFESRSEEKTADHSITVLNIIAEHYDNVYTRTHPEKIRENAPVHYGFHMNKQTKPLVYSYLLKACRHTGFIERDKRAVDEYKTLETDTRGRINAVEGAHDDIADPSAIGLYISEEEMDAPKEVRQVKFKSKKIINESSF